MTRQSLKRALYGSTLCDIQHDGWPCGNCFFSMSDSLSNQDWQALLLYRGDYSLDELDNLPADIHASLNKIYAIAMEVCDE